MAVVNVTVNGRVYEIACDDSQVERVHELAADVDGRAQTLLAALGAVSDSRLLVMVGLMLADELGEAREELGRLAEALSTAAIGDSRLASGVAQLARRIEGIAERLERA